MLRLFDIRTFTLLFTLLIDYAMPCRCYADYTGERSVTAAAARRVRERAARCHAVQRQRHAPRRRRAGTRARHAYDAERAACAAACARMRCDAAVAIAAAHSLRGAIRCAMRALEFTRYWRAYVYMAFTRTYYYDNVIRAQNTASARLCVAAPRYAR